MFGWEFPPHISGGLGTACFGLTRGLSLADMDILFVVPKAFGDEDQGIAQIIGAGDVPIRRKKIIYRDTNREMHYIEAGNQLIPYRNYDNFEFFSSKVTKDWDGIQETVMEGVYHFEAGYGNDLYLHVENYTVVAAQIAANHQFDVIHAHDWLTYMAGVNAKKVSGKPLIVHLHATEFDRSGKHINQHVYNIEKTGMLEADLVIAVSNFTRNIAIEKYGIPAHKVITVYNAVEPLEAEKEVFPRSLDDKIVTFLGRITLQKGPEYFIEAAYEVLQRMSNVRFVMAGSGDLLNRMVQRVAELGISNRFHFTGFLKGKDVDKMFSMSDVYVMPSVSEPFGISPLEAMRSHVPVIISKQSGVSEVLKYAIKVDFWDIKSTADAIYGLLKYEGLPNMFKKYGKEEVDSFKWENAALEVKKAYESIC